MEEEKKSFTFCSRTYCMYLYVPWWPFHKSIKHGTIEFIWGHVYLDDSTMEILLIITTISAFYGPLLILSCQDFWLITNSKLATVAS